MNIYAWILFISSIWDGLLYYVKNYMYSDMLKLCKFTRMDFVSNLEKCLFKIQKVSQCFPYFIIKPNDYKLKKIGNEINESVWFAETILIIFEYIIAVVHKIFGVRIAYVFLLLIYIWQQCKTQIVEVVKCVGDILNKVDVVAFLQNVYDYVLENGSGILIIIIIFLGVYIRFLKGKKSRYEFEKIWNDDLMNCKKEVAKSQKNIRKYSLELYKRMMNNMFELKKIIDEMDKYKIKAGKNLSEVNTEKFYEYESVVSCIKREIKHIDEIEGFELYFEYNQKMWDQLYLLSLTGYDKKYYNVESIGRCDKSSLECILRKDYFSSYESARSLLVGYWRDAIICLNRIERYLNYMEKRENKFRKINKKLNRIGSMKDVIMEIKSNVEN